MSTRSLPSVVATALSADEIFPFFAVELLFDAAPMRLWTGYTTTTLGGNSYTATGELLNISIIEETTEISVRGANITLSGIPSANISIVLQTPYQGRVCNIYFGVSVNGVNSDLVQIFSGFMDEMNINETPETSSIELKVENKLIDLERARVSRYTSAYQKSKFPTDKGLDFVESIQGKSTLWGR